MIKYLLENCFLLLGTPTNVGNSISETTCRMLDTQQCGFCENRPSLCAIDISPKDSSNGSNPPRQPFCDMSGCLPKATRWCENRCAWPSLLLSYGLFPHMTLRRFNRCEYAYPARVEEDATKILKANIAERCKDFEMPALSVSDKPRNVCRTYRKMWHPTCSSQYLNLFCPD